MSILGLKPKNINIIPYEEKSEDSNFEAFKIRFC